MKFDKYYKNYWKKRGKAKTKPIPNVPSFLKKYSVYGSILNQVKEGSRILDLGCGDGNVSSIYLSKNCEVYGVDISKSACSLAKRKGIKTRVVDLNKSRLPFKSRFFDYVIGCDVLEHLIDPLAIVKEISRVLKKAGFFLLSVPNFARITNRFRMIIGNPIDSLHFDKYGDEVEHLHWFTLPKLNHLLNNAGFKEIKSLPSGLPFSFIFTFLGFSGLSKVLTIKAGEGGYKR